MGARVDLHAGKAMATRWRRRQLCVLVANGERPAAIRTISASGAFIETACRPALGSVVALRHPEAGAIAGRVEAHHADGVSLRLDGSEAAMAFALSTIAADMSRPA